MTHGMRYAIHNGRFAASATIAELKIQIKNRAKKKTQHNSNNCGSIGPACVPTKIILRCKIWVKLTKFSLNRLMDRHLPFISKDWNQTFFFSATLHKNGVLCVHITFYVFVLPISVEGSWLLLPQFQNIAELIWIVNGASNIYLDE